LQSHPNSIFRENALKNLTPLTVIEDTVQIIKPSAWLILVCAFSFLMGFGIWICLAKVEITVPAIGIIIGETEFELAEKMWQESIGEHQEKLTILKTLFDKQKDLYQQHYITINELEKGREDYLNAKEQLSVISRQSVISTLKPRFNLAPGGVNQTLDALIFVSHEQGKKIIAGDVAYILPNLVSVFEYGYVVSKVISVSEYPVSKDAVNSYLGNIGLVDEFFGNSVPFMVRVRLSRDSHGLKWSSGRIPDFTVGEGTTVTGNIVVKVCSPWRLVFLL
jgi:hypothetical protein